MSEARTEARLDRLEEDVAEIKMTLRDLVPIIHRIDERLNAELPHLRTEMSHLATKAEVAKLPTRAYLWGVLAAIFAAQAVAIGAAALLMVPRT